MGIETMFLDEDTSWRTGNSQNKCVKLQGGWGRGMPTMGLKRGDYGDKLHIKLVRE